MEKKKKIRQEILTLRDALPEAERMAMSEQICKNIKSLPEFVSAEQLLLFASYGSEPDTLMLIKECLSQGKKVYCPTVLGETMEFYRMDTLEDLKEGYKGILEPIPDEERNYVPMKNDFMLLPGTVFDREGNRIGYGKGFYDKYLAGGYTGEMAAAAFSFQIVANNRIPAEETDCKIKCIVTEKEIVRI